MVTQLVERGRLGRVGRRHHGGDGVAPALVGDADHQHVGDLGVVDDLGLDLLGEHLLAAGVDALRPAPQELDGAVGLHRGHVAGEAVALAVDLHERGRRLLGVVEVAQRQPAGVGHPAHVARAGGDLAVVGVEHLGARGRGEAGQPGDLVARLEALGALHAALGRPEAVEDGPAGEQLGQPGLEARRDRAATVGEGEQAGHVPPVGVGLPRVDQRTAHGVAHDGERVDAFGGHGVPDRLAVESTGHQHTGAAGEEPGPGGPLGRGVHHRRQRQVDEGRHHAVDQFGRRGHGSHQAHGVAAADAGEEGIFLTPHHALGSAGGATGVHQVVVVTGAALGDHRFGRRRGQGLLVGHGAGQVGLVAVDCVRSRVVDHQQRLHAGHRVGHRGDLSGEGAVHEQGHRRRVVEQVAELLAGVAVVDVHRNGPQGEGRDHGLQVHLIVAQEQRHVVARTHARSPQVVGQPVGPLGELPVGGTLGTAHQRGAIGGPGPDRLPQVGEVVGGGQRCVDPGRRALLVGPLGPLGHT